MIIDTLGNSIGHIDWMKTKRKGEEKEKLKYLWNCFINIDNWDVDEKNKFFLSDTRSLSPLLQ